MNFVPGNYLIGDIKTFSGRSDVESLDEGVHTLYDGAIVALYKIPDYLDSDELMYDQDNNSYSCESGYVGIIRADYLPFGTITEHHAKIDADGDLHFHYTAVLFEFSTSKFETDDDGDFIALGGRFLTHLENENANDDYEDDDV